MMDAEAMMQLKKTVAARVLLLLWAVPVASLLGGLLGLEWGGNSAVLAVGAVWCGSLGLVWAVRGAPG